MVVETHGLSKFTHVAMILEDPPERIIYLIYALADRCQGLVDWSIIKPFVNSGAPGLPPIKLDTLIPEGIREKYQDYLLDNGLDLTMQNTTTLGAFSCSLTSSKPLTPYHKNI